MISIRLHLIAILAIACITVACQPAATRPTIQPFPSMTPGQRINGQLDAPGVRPIADTSGQTNPATAVALASRPTATPNMRVCPILDDNAALADDIPATRSDASTAILRFLNAGGTVDALRDGLDNTWDALPDIGYVRNDGDLTGEGTPELLIGYIAPGNVGTLLIFGCEGGRYVQLYETIADGFAPPEIIWLDDMTNSNRDELVYTRRQCSDAESCEYQTQILSWDTRTGRLANLLDDILLSLTVPTVRDVDDDRVTELVVNLESSGTSATGPLRTGVHIYDWNGSVYTLSIVQLDPPRYRIQLIHEADRSFSRLEMADAIPLYELVLDETANYGYWFNDGQQVITTYALYRLILAYAYEGNPQQIVDTLTRLNSEFRNEELPLDEQLVYVHLANTFVDVISTTSNLNDGCDAVRDIITNDRPEALTLLNRYGSRSPAYDTLLLCPY